MNFKSLKSLTLALSPALLLLLEAGCASTPESASSWPNYVTPASTISTNNISKVTPELISEDITLVHDANIQLEQLTKQLATLSGTIDTSTRNYITENENKLAEHILYEFMLTRQNLLKIMTYYRTTPYPDNNQRIKGATIFMYAGISINYYTSRLVAICINNKRLINILNASHNKYGISKNSYNKLFMQVTDISNIKLIDTAWKLFEKELYTPNSPVAKLISSDPDFDFTDELKNRYFDTYVQIRYILYASGKVFANVENLLRHTRARKLGDEAIAAAESHLYHAQGTIYKNVARIKNPTSHPLNFSLEQVQQIKSMLRPGDILLTYSAGYMSNLFLPGNFKHGITYIGSVQDRKDAGLSPESIKQHAVLPEQIPILKKQIATAEQPHDYEANVIEAVAEGVIINSLDFLIKNHINRMLVLRPHISRDEKIAQLIDLFLHVGVPYDFNFNFSDDSYQCCTELIYRTLNNKGSINFSFSKINGKWVLSADNIVDYFLNTNPDAFDIILLAEKSNINNKAKILTGAESLARLRELTIKK